MSQVDVGDILNLVLILTMIHCQEDNTGAVKILSRLGPALKDG